MLFLKKPNTEYTVGIYDNCPWIIEAIDEVFDDVLCQLDLENSYIYGGSVRDLLAGVPLIGDLDILVENTIFEYTVDIFRFSPRWSLKYISDGSKYERVKPPNSKTTSSGNIKKIATFINKSKSEIQLISPTGHDREFTDTIPCSRSLWNIARYVDIRCSGILTTLVGDVYETVPGAIDDCRKRVLNINQGVTKETVGIKRLHERIDKLTKRGWTNNINLEDYPLPVEQHCNITSTKTNTYEFLKDIPLWQK